MKKAPLATNPRPALLFSWADAISQPEWEIYKRAIHALRDEQIPFLLAGGFALATYTGRWRDTKDIDFYIHPDDRDRGAETLGKAGFEDYYPRLRYDRNWIYRSVRENIIVDIIWSMANQRAHVDGQWFERASSVTIRGEELQVIPVEELLWCKLYIMQRDHCDWTDLFNLLYARGTGIDWDHVFERVENDVPLLRGLLSVYEWLCPESAGKFPADLWERLGLPDPESVPRQEQHDPVKLLDSRTWFGADITRGEKLQV